MHNVTEKEKLEVRRSKVRIWVTYSATYFLFIGGTGFIIFLLWKGGDHISTAKDIFLTILPVSAAIISYWFAGRGKGPENSPDNHSRENQARFKCDQNPSMVLV